MSDGDNATPGPPRLPGPPDAGGDNQWLTRTSRPSPGAAPWERNGTPAPENVEKSKQTGNHHHADGVTVADLIAKVHGDSSVPAELRRPRPEPEAPPPPIPPSPPP